MTLRRWVLALVLAAPTTYALTTAVLTLHHRLRGTLTR